MVLRLKDAHGELLGLARTALDMGGPCVEVSGDKSIVRALSLPVLEKLAAIFILILNSELWLGYWLLHFKRWLRGLHRAASTQERSDPRCCAGFIFSNSLAWTRLLVGLCVHSMSVLTNNYAM